MFWVSTLDILTTHIQYTLPAATAINGSPDDNSVHYNPTYCHVL